MNDVSMSPLKIDKKCVAIVKFGPAMPTSGMRPAEYFQCTIDPAMASPSGEYIRFGQNPGDEIMGWQRVEAITIVELLGDWNGDESPTMHIGVNNVTMMTVD